MRLSGFLIVIAVFFAWTVPAQALSCSFSNTGVNFGNVNLLSGGFQSATGTFTAECTGNARQTVRICPNFNAGSGGIHPSGDPRYLSQGATTLRYDLFRSNGVGQPWGSYTWPYSARPPVLTITLNGNGFGSVSQTIYARLYNQQGALPTGTYTSSFSGSNTQIDYGYSSSFNCSSALSSRVQNVPFIVRATNNSTCSVSANDLNFGAQPSLAMPVLATNAISVTCTAGTQYEIGLSSVLFGGNPAMRRMINILPVGAVQYQIYRDNARTQLWGDTAGTNTASGVGNGSTQTFTGFGLVPPQATPPSGTYYDFVVVVVTY